MSWFLVVLMLSGGVAYIPMESQEACERAKTTISRDVGSHIARTACVKGD